MSPGRRAECAAVLESVVRWAVGRDDVRAVGLAGSWARDAAHQGSDVDVVLLTDTPAHYLRRTDWVVAAVGQAGARLVRTATWGPLTERRVRLRSGLEVEVGVARPAWAAVAPVDPGTAGVVADGFRALHDPDGLLAALVAAVTAGRAPGGG